MSQANIGNYKKSVRTFDPTKLLTSLDRSHKNMFKHTYGGVYIDRIAPNRNIYFALQVSAGHGHASEVPQLPYHDRFPTSPTSHHVVRYGNQSWRMHSDFPCCGRGPQGLLIFFYFSISILNKLFI